MLGTNLYKSYVFISTFAKDMLVKDLRVKTDEGT